MSDSDPAPERRHVPSALPDCRVVQDPAGKPPKAALRQMSSYVTFVYSLEFLPLINRLNAALFATEADTLSIGVVLGNYKCRRIEFWREH